MLPRPTDERTSLRLTFLGALLVSVLVVLLARLWFVQIVAGERFASLAERGRVRTVEVEAPRGRILDRRGRVLVDNRQVHVIGVQLDEMGDRRSAVLGDLAALLGLTRTQLEERIAEGDTDAVRPVPVAFDVPERTALYVWEQQSTTFPGVHADLVPRRAYPHGTLAAHLVGYTAEITAEQLAQDAYREYHAGVQTGMAGVERIHEALLRGRAGERRYEIDATGDVVRQLSEQLPEPGADLQLTLDRDVQRLVEDALATGLRRARRLVDREGRGDGTFAAPAGAALVLDPADGAVLAMASLPTFRPDDFVGGISAGRYANLVDPDRHAPLLNRVVQAAHPPGSVFKIVTTSAALRGGFATPRTTLPCPGVWRWDGAGQRFRNWTSADMGDMTLADALTNSCDTVFYELARRMWMAEERRDRHSEHLSDEATRFGYGTVLGVDLPGERPGVVPGRAWRRDYWQDNHGRYCAQAQRATADARRLLRELCGPQGAVWRGGDAINMSIGQGDLLATPLQVAASVAAVANGGTVWRPHVTAAARRAGREVDRMAATRLGRVDIDRATLRVLRRGLRGVTAPRGTAADAFDGVALPVAGKTGTAESPTQPFAWFAGYAPADDPRYVVVTMLEEGGSGSRAAAPIARWIVDGLAALEERSG